jgi:hypothetical protein
MVSLLNLIRLITLKLDISKIGSFHQRTAEFE